MKTGQASVQRDLLRQAMSDGRVMSWAEMEGRGVGRRALMGMLSAGDMIRVDHGIYRLADAPVDSYSDWDDLAAKYTSDGFLICMLTAARHHGLITQMPADTWVGLPHGSKPTKSGIRVVALRRTGMDGKPHAMWTEGVERVGTQGRQYKMTNPARTVVDLWRWRHRIPDGERICLEALREYDDKQMDRGALRRIARVFNVADELSGLLMAKSEFLNNY